MNSDLAVGLHIVGFLTARDGEPLTSNLLAETYGTSPVVIRRVLSRLNQAGLVETKRGAGGGSVLARAASQINLRQVYEAVARNPELLRRHPGQTSGVADVLSDYINELCGEAEEALLRRLEKVSVKQMDAVVKPRICELLRRRN
ncbi:MAG: Rrf2 family transcriptional regulator [Planctomycetaceae bacterium]|nr:Rrf2 family transcriptional regulator [Planctomycetaceae bacterium]